LQAYPSGVIDDSGKVGDSQLPRSSITGGFDGWSG
jgi:hypothetical protein